MKALEYRVVETNGVRGLADLVAQVNDLLAAGWEPTGGVYVVFSHITKNWWYYQSMVKKEQSN